MTVTAIIPAAGLGTRFLPFTRVVSKELLPILTRPAIHYVLEELADAGIQKVVIITREGKDDLRRYCEDDELRSLFSGISLRWTVQETPRGLGHAVMCAEGAVQDDWVLVALPDVVIDAAVGCSRQMLDAFQKSGRPMIATHRETQHPLSSYGVLDIAPQQNGRLLKIHSLVEKPAEGQAPSNWVVSGRYLLPREIFSVIRSTPPGSLGEIQLTDALNTLCASHGMDGLAFDGHLMDAGNVKGWLDANLHFAEKQGLF